MSSLHDFLALGIFSDLHLTLGVFPVYVDVIMMMIDDLLRTLYRVFILSNYCLVASYSSRQLRLWAVG
jgi:hypothetical protein